MKATKIEIQQCAFKIYTCLYKELKDEIQGGLLILVCPLVK